MELSRAPVLADLIHFLKNFLWSIENNRCTKSCFAIFMKLIGWVKIEWNRQGRTQGFFGHTAGNVFRNSQSAQKVGAEGWEKLEIETFLERWKMHFPRCFPLLSAIERDKEQQNVR